MINMWFLPGKSSESRGDNVVGFQAKQKYSSVGVTYRAQGVWDLKDVTLDLILNDK